MIKLAHSEVAAADSPPYFSRVDLRRILSGTSFGIDGSEN